MNKKLFFSDCLSHEYFGSFFTPAWFVLFCSFSIGVTNKQKINENEKFKRTHSEQTELKQLIGVGMLLD